MTRVAPPAPLIPFEDTERARLQRQAHWKTADYALTVKATRPRLLADARRKSTDARPGA